MKEDSNPDGWTFSTLYKHTMALADAQKDAVEKADRANEKRFDSVNEFRNTLKDQSATFADKEATDRRLKILEDAHAQDRGKSQGVGMVAIVVNAAILILIALAALYLRK